MDSLNPTFENSSLSVHQDPNILTRSLKNTIIPSFDILESILHTHTNIAKFLKQSTFWVLRINGLKHLRVNYLIIKPRLFMGDADKFNKIVEKVKGMGFDPLATTFLQAIERLTSMTEATWRKKNACLQEMGLLRRRFTAVMDFLVNEIGYDSLIIAEKPWIFTYSLKEWIIPRCSVIIILVSKDLIEEKISLVSLGSLTDKSFSDKFVKPYEQEAPALMKEPSWFEALLGSQSQRTAQEDYRSQGNHHGMRHYWGLRVRRQHTKTTGRGGTFTVRGQHTKTTGRRGTTIGVSKELWRLFELLSFTLFQKTFLLAVNVWFHDRVMNHRGPWTAHQDYRSQGYDCWCLREALETSYYSLSGGTISWGLDIGRNLENGQIQTWAYLLGQLLRLMDGRQESCRLWGRSTGFSFQKNSSLLARSQLFWTRNDGLSWMIILVSGVDSIIHECGQILGEAMRAANKEVILNISNCHQYYYTSECSCCWQYC
ncbi:hypothetical protein C5167_037042 [Papaver somniferum]|uniref:Uncharacterized protein n=1 Tax=Papaver somniferum TaxID=3469 RepID=A0A4Y7I7T4_PAPSO|nr:hypothetical protein C5167_037042 [Papaver somniferum]